MVYLPNVIMPNGIAIVLLMTLLISTRRTLHHTLLDEKLFFIMVLTNLFQCVVEASTYVIDGTPGQLSHVIALVLNALLYCNNILFAFLWTIYADFKVFGDVERLRKRYPIVAIPAILVIGASLVNIFTPIFFRITSENIYQRTGLYYVPYVVTYFYLVYGIALIYLCQKKAEKYLFLPAMIFTLPIFIGSALQFLFYGYSLTWIGVAVALVSLYVNVQNEISYTDSLSGLFTRQYMYQHLNLAIRHVDERHRLAGILLDIDKFKKINDTYGHLVGDDAIRSTGLILRDSLRSDAIAIRFAGDEFIILQHISDEQEIKSAIEQIERSAQAFFAEHPKPYTLTFSCGYSIYDKDTDTVDSFLGCMDAAMYEVKKLKSSAPR